MLICWFREKQNFWFINQTLSSELRLHENIHGITNNLEQDSEVKVTEDDLGLVKYIIEQSIQNSSNDGVCRLSFIKCNAFINFSYYSQKSISFFELINSVN